MKRAIVGVLIVAAGLSIAGCSSGPDKTSGKDFAEAMREQWPLTVDEVAFECPGRNQIVLIADGKKYAVNGLAKQTGRYGDITEIWKDDPDTAGLKMDLEPVQQLGETECHTG